jgi:hypothetical protein
MLCVKISLVKYVDFSYFYEQLEDFYRRMWVKEMGKKVILSDVYAM